jgi:ribosomal protein S28E/S33
VPSFRTGTVTELLQERPGLQRVGTDAGRAYVLTQLTGPVAVGDMVVLNTTAVELGLGTGGWHVVHWNLARDAWVEPGPGHIMKVRYTSLQVDTGAAEEAHPDLPRDLAGMPVVVCSLHSQVPCVAAAILASAPSARIAYVMTDGAALPLVISDLVVAMVDSGLLAATITAGHAFGGDLEAVTVASALALACHVVAADVAIVAMGPGVVGTGTELGTTSVEVAAALDVAAALGGRPIAALRMSDGDSRDRHRGVSHHSRTALDLTRSSVLVASPDENAFEHARHDVRVASPPPMAELLADAGLQVTTMGRGPADDPVFFAAAGAAGVLAASLLPAAG